MSCEKIKLVTSVNGETGDVVIKLPDASNFYTRSEADIMFNNKADKTDIPDVSIYNPTDNFKTVNGNSIIGQGDIHIEGGAVTSVNGQTGDVVIDIPTVPTNVSAFVNDSGYITETALDRFNPTDNFKTINGESVIGTGDITIQGGGDDKMDKINPIFTENTEIDEINPEFRLHGFIKYSSFYGVFNYDCVERYYTSRSLWVNWDYQAISTYINKNPATQYAAVKAFCRADSIDYGHCKYHLYILRNDGYLENIDQYMQDTHVYGPIFESTGIQQSSRGYADSRDPNDNIISMVNGVTGNTAVYYIRKGVTHYIAFTMLDTNVFFNTAWEYPYMTSLIDIKGILENYSTDEYTALRVEIVTDNTDHWHIMSTNLFFTNDTDFMIHTKIHKEYVLIDALNEKATKTDLDNYNPTNNFRTINGESIIGTDNIYIQSGGVTSVNGSTGDVTIVVPVTSVNGATGDVVIEVPTDYVNNDTFNQFVQTQTAKNQELNNKIDDIDLALTNILGDGL